MDVYELALELVKEHIGHNTTTTDIELNEACRKLFGHRFIGVYPIDLMSDKQGLQIVNLDTSKQPGSHWIATVKDGEYTTVYDSLGRLNDLKDNEYLKVIRPSIIMTEDDREQNLQETNCGQRCIAWLLVYEIGGKEMALTI